MIAPESNRLDFGWVRSYRGRLRVTFGERRRPTTETYEHRLEQGTTVIRF